MPEEGREDPREGHTEEARSQQDSRHPAPSATDGQEGPATTTTTRAQKKVDFTEPPKGEDPTDGSNSHDNNRSGKIDGEEGQSGEQSFGTRWTTALDDIEKQQFDALSGTLSESMSIVSQIIQEVSPYLRPVDGMELGQQSGPVERAEPGEPTMQASLESELMRAQLRRFDSLTLAQSRARLEIGAASFRSAVVYPIFWG